MDSTAATATTSTTTPSPPPRREEVLISSIERGTIYVNGKTRREQLYSTARASVDQRAVEDYSRAMDEGTQFPSVVVFFDGERYWLADGLHRVKAADDLGMEIVSAEVHLGSQEDAAWYSYSANTTHGVRRTYDDLRKVMEGALQHPRAAGMSDNALAKHVGVSDKTVANWHRKLSMNQHLLPLTRAVGESLSLLLAPSSEPPKIDPPVERTVTRKGQTYKMNTSAIGKNKKTSGIFRVQSSPVAALDPEQFTVETGVHMQNYRLKEFEQPSPQTQGEEFQKRAMANFIATLDGLRMLLRDPRALNLEFVLAASTPRGTEALARKYLTGLHGAGEGQPEAGSGEQDRSQATDPSTKGEQREVQAMKRSRESTDNNEEREAAEHIADWRRGWRQNSGQRLAEMVQQSMAAARGQQQSEQEGEHDRQ